MGEAYLHNHGGLSYSLAATFYPRSNVFIVGQPSNDGRATITATLGGTQIVIPPDECTFSPATIAADTTAITITKKIGGMTRSVSLPITAISVSSTFGDNTWDAIAAAAYSGLASDLWSPGDEKTEYISGVQHTFRILGFNHNDLSANDDMIGSGYNGGSGKAAIALQFDSPIGPAAMHSSNPVGLRFSETDMATSFLPALLASFPTAMKNAVRLVDVWESYYVGMQDYVAVMYKEQFKLFLPSVFEIMDWKETDSSGRVIYSDAPYREFGIPLIRKADLYDLFSHEKAGAQENLYKWYYHLGTNGDTAVREWLRDSGNSGQYTTPFNGSFRYIAPNTNASGGKNSWGFSSADTNTLNTKCFPIFNI